MTGKRGTRPFWLAPEARFIRPELGLAAIAVVGMLLVEVWQTARMAELCLELDRARAGLVEEHARYGYAQAGIERGSTRDRIDPLAKSLGLAPATGDQVVILPANWLPEDPVVNDAESVHLAWVERMSRALIPEATARSRTGR